MQAADSQAGQRLAETRPHKANGEFLVAAAITLLPDLLYKQDEQRQQNTKALNRLRTMVIT